MARHRVATFEKIPEGKAWPITVDDIDIMLVRFGERVYAIEDCCSHQEFPLSQGEICKADCTVRCRAHGATFNLETGKALTAPAFAPVPVYNVSIEDGEVYVDLED